MKLSLSSDSYNEFPGNLENCYPGRPNLMPDASEFHAGIYPVKMPIPEEQP